MRIAYGYLSVSNGQSGGLDKHVLKLDTSVEFDNSFVTTITATLYK